LAPPPDSTTKFVSTRTVNDFKTCIIFYNSGNYVKCLNPPSPVYLQDGGTSFPSIMTFFAFHRKICYSGSHGLLRYLVSQTATSLNAIFKSRSTSDF
jgi:hypothetical protein